MSEDEVEIIHTSQNSVKQQLAPEDVETIKKENQKLQSTNNSLRMEAKQYKELLQKSIENLKQSEKDQFSLKLQLSQKESQIQSFQDEAQRANRLKESTSNRESFGNKLTNISTCEYTKFSQVSSSPNHDSICRCPYFFAQKQHLAEEIAKTAALLKQGGDKQPIDLLKNLMDLEESLKKFGTIDQQLIPEPSISDNFQSIEEHQNSLDTSQFDGEMQIQQSFDLFESQLNKCPEEEKIVWKQKLLQLINSL